MPTGQMISLGIGSPASIKVLDLTGLFPSQVASNQETGSIPIGPAASLTANVIYALPARKVNIEWQSTIATNLDISLDRTNWVTVAPAIILTCLAGKAYTVFWTSALDGPMSNEFIILL